MQFFVFIELHGKCMSSVFPHMQTKFLVNQGTLSKLQMRGIQNHKSQHENQVLI